MRILSVVAVAVFFSFVSFAETLVPGVMYHSWTKSLEKEVRFTAVKIDLSRKDVLFVGQGRAPNFDAPLPDTNTIYNIKEEKILPSTVVTLRMSPKDFLKKSKCHIAFAARPTRRPYCDEYACPFGLFISRGRVVSRHRARDYPVFVVRTDGRIEVADAVMPIEYESISFAVAGDAILRKDGKSRSQNKTQLRGSCMAMGVTSDRKFLVVLSADNGKRVSSSPLLSAKDIDDVLADMDVSDAILFDNSSTSHAAIFASDGENPIRQLNAFPKGETVYRAAYSIGLKVKDRPLLPFRSNSSAQKRQNKAFSAQIRQVKLSAFREHMRKSAPRTVLRGQVRVNVKTSWERFKRPVLAVMALFEKDGAWRYYDTLLSEQKSSSGRALGIETTAQAISRSQMEVSADQWVQIVYGEPKGGFLRGYGISPENVKLIAYRVEFWQNGALVASHDSVDSKTLRKLDLPEDWYLRGKYKNKIVYCNPPPPPEKK